MNLTGMIRRLVNLMLRPFGQKLVRRQHDQFYYRHDYGKGGYEQYKRVQEYHNRRKITQVWADESTLSVVADYVTRHVEPVRGLCHGTRNGFEQRFLSEHLGIPVVGTEISSTATDFPNTVQWDFQEPRDEWLGQFSFVYSNSFDHAFDPPKTLDTWVGQVHDGGLVIIELTLNHGPESVSEMDPFGVHPMAFPYLLALWGEGKYYLQKILRPPPKSNTGIDVWLFVIAAAQAPMIVTSGSTTNEPVA